MERQSGQVEALRREVRLLRWLVLCAIVAMAGITVLWLLDQSAEEDGILRVKGLVVEDDQGRARILVGAPAPYVQERIRTDRDAVIRAWGERYGGDMDWYFENVNNDVFGVLILDETGHDRVAIGSPTPDPATGARVEPSHGIQFNDAEGIEVGGLGHFVERGYIGLGMDNSQGEGLYLLAANNGTSGIIVNDLDGSRRMFIGNAAQESGLTRDGRSLLGISVVDQSDDTWWELEPEPSSEAGR